MMTRQALSAFPLLLAAVAWFVLPLLIGGIEAYQSYVELERAFSSRDDSGGLFDSILSGSLDPGSLADWMLRASRGLLSESLTLLFLVGLPLTVSLRRLRGGSVLAAGVSFLSICVFLTFFLLFQVGALLAFAGQEVLSMGESSFLWEMMKGLAQGCMYFGPGAAVAGWLLVREQAPETVRRLFSPLRRVSTAGLLIRATAVTGIYFALKLLLAWPNWQAPRYIEETVLPRTAEFAIVIVGVVAAVFLCSRTFNRRTHEADWGIGRALVAATLAHCIIIPIVSYYFIRTEFSELAMPPEFWTYVRLDLLWGIFPTSIAVQVGLLAVLCLPRFALAEAGDSAE